MLTHDLGYYVAVLLRRDETMSLFPEFYKLFYKYTLAGSLEGLRIHPAYRKAVVAVAEEHGADPEELDDAIDSVLNAIIEAERENHFSLVWDFIYYFEGTRIEIPTRQDFERVLRDAKVYVRVMRAGDQDAEVKKLAQEGAMDTADVRKIVERVRVIVGE